jgi:Na+-translocating ferredoxin:NAD+ oxidoreductase RnfG subunit
MAGQIEKVTTNQVPEAELRIVEVASSGTIVRLQGISVATTPGTGEKIELKEGKFKVVEVSHEFSGSPLKHVVVVAVEKPQPTVAE